MMKTRIFNQLHHNTLHNKKELLQEWLELLLFQTPGEKMDHQSLKDAI